MIYWAHIDKEGNIVSCGHNQSIDVFRNKLEDGLICLARPPEVNCFDGWKYNFTDNMFYKE